MYRREYGKANKLLNSEMTSKESACTFAQLLLGEIKDMCHLDSIFQNTSSAIHNFSWEIIWNELHSKTPTLLQFYKHMFRPSASSCCFMNLSIIPPTTLSMAVPFLLNFVFVIFFVSSLFTFSVDVPGYSLCVTEVFSSASVKSSSTCVKALST